MLHNPSMFNKANHTSIMTYRFGFWIPTPIFREPHEHALAARVAVEGGLDVPKVDGGGAHLDIKCDAIELRVVVVFTVDVSLQTRT